MERDDRKRIWVDRFQTQLSLRIMTYMVLFLLVLFNCLFAWQMWQEGPGNPWEQMLHTLSNYLPVIICLMVLVPVITWDALRFSHRLVGPLVRFRCVMQDVARGEPVLPIKLREGDYLVEFRDDFNAMLESLQRRGLPVLKPLDPPTDEKTKRTSA